MEMSGETYQCTEAVDILGCLCPISKIWDEVIQQDHGIVTTLMTDVTMTRDVVSHV